MLEVSPTPTAQLDAENLAKFYLTNRKLQSIRFPSREGIQLSMDPRSIRKVVYSHSTELGLSDLGSRIPCPIQDNPNFFQRTNCWAITDANIREAVVKIFEFTTFDNPRIISLEQYPPFSAYHRTYKYILIKY